MSDPKWCYVSDIIGVIFSKVEKIGESIVFTCDDGPVYILEHSQDCCEQVYIESIVGDLADLVGVPITFADESTRDDPANSELGRWTFYKFATRKGWVDLRWYGSSNGYYGVGVSFYCKEVL